MPSDEISIFIDGSSLLAYSLNDGTVGVYNEGVRLWRIKVDTNLKFHLKITNGFIGNFTLHHFLQSKSKGLSIACFDLLGTGSLQGKLFVR